MRELISKNEKLDILPYLDNVYKLGSLWCMKRRQGRMLRQEIEGRRRNVNVQLHRAKFVLEEAAKILQFPSLF